MADLSRVGERNRSKPQRGDEPHWQRLRAGCSVGYRPSKLGGRGTWFARAYDGDTRKYRRQALGDYGSLSGNEVFAAAKKDAEAWADKVECGGVLAEKIDTVADACRAYILLKPNLIAEGVFRRHVYDDPVARISLGKLRRHHLLDWRKRLEEALSRALRPENGKKPPILALRQTCLLLAAASLRLIAADRTGT